LISAIRKLAVAAVLAFALTPALVAASGLSAPPEARAAVLRWLSLIDGQDYGAAWDQASPSLQREISRTEWSEALKAGNSQLGPLRKRTLGQSRIERNPPAAPQGEYSLFRFSSEYATAIVSECVVLQQESGVWKIVAFWLEE